MLYAVGGWDGGNLLSSVEVYDPRTNAWKAVAPMSTKRYGLAASVLTVGGQEQLYAVGGRHGSPLNSVEVYD